MKKGFTLVEILTVVVLIGLIVTASFSTYTSSRDKSKLDDAMRKIETLFNTVRNNAITGLNIEGALPADHGLHFKQDSDQVNQFAELGTVFFNEEGADYYNYKYDNQAKDALVASHNLDEIILTNIYVATGDPAAWQENNQDLNVTFLLPKAELRLWDESEITSTNDSYGAACLNFNSQYNSKSIIIDQTSPYLSISKTACADRELP